MRRAILNEWHAQPKRRRIVLIRELMFALVILLLFLFAGLDIADLSKTLEVFTSESSKNTFLLLFLSCLWACFWAIPSAYFQAHSALDDFFDSEI